MSVDRRLDQLCPHQVSEEFLMVLGDQRTFRPVRPISNAGSVRVRLNGEITVPFEGVHTSASVLGTREGPFKVPSSSTLSLSVHGGESQTAIVPASASWNPASLARLLGQSFRGVSFSVEYGHIRMQSDLSGEDSSIYVLASSTLGAILGISVDREYRGKRVVPGWSLVNDPNTLNDRPTRLVYFDDNLLGFNDYIEVDYTTLREECRRCGGTGFENDWSYGQDGRVLEVRDSDLFLQEFNKITATDKGSNPFHLWYGSLLRDQIGTKNMSQGIVQNLIKSDIQQVFSRWQSVKSQQEKNVGQYVSDEEFPFRLGSVVVEQSSQDPTVVFITITSYNRSSKKVSISRGIRIPGYTDYSQSQSQKLYQQGLNSSTVVG